MFVNVVRWPSRRFAGRKAIRICMCQLSARPKELVPPCDVDGSRGTCRVPHSSTSTLSASNNYQAVQAWLNLQEAETTRRAYRQEVKRLMHWSILEQGEALTSLTTEDAIAY